MDLHGHDGLDRVEHLAAPAVPKVVPAGPAGGQTLQELSARGQNTSVSVCVAAVVVFLVFFLTLPRRIPR